MLAQEDIKQIQTLIQSALDSKLGLETGNVHYDLELRERAVRVEEELKHQRELMIQGFEQMERRFEQMEKRFEQIDKRFEQVERRFEQIDKRFEQVDKRLEQFEKRFEQIDKRFEAMQDDIKTLYTLINSQIWRMIGAIGAIVVLSRMVDLFA